ncbi:MAG: fibronectin type III domain-containing protein, partial [Anaerolineae bacterium]|nr:fibronectin type III domain-containing protein [Anaerolineae bacterium]
GTLSPAHLDARFVFGPGDTLSINTPLATLSPAAQPGTPLAPDDSVINTNVAGNVVFMLEQPAGGGLTLELIAPNGDHYTPTNDRPDAYNEFETDGMRYIMVVENYASSGTWRANVKGNTASTPFTYTVLGSTPPPYLTQPRLEQTGPLSATVSWASHIYTGTQTNVVGLFAATGPLARTFAYTDSNGLLQSETLPVYEGFAIAEGLDYRTRTYNLDLSHLPSGDYAFWVQVDDGETTPKKAYFSENGYGAPLTITLDHSASFTTTAWTTVITPLIDIKTGDGWFTWTPMPHPDVQTYTLALQSASPLTPTLAVTREATVAAGRTLTPSALLDNLEPGAFYTLTIAADAGLGLLAWSQPYTFTTEQPNFIISATLDITVAAGSRVVLPLHLIIAEDLPYDLAFDVDAATPDGFALVFAPDVVTARGETAAAVTIRPLAGVYTGTYAVPIVAYSGALKREVVLNVTVTPFNPTVYLPLVMRNTP